MKKHVAAVSADEKCPSCGSGNSNQLGVTINERKCNDCGQKFRFKPKRTLKVGKRE